jgi:hypothetical protein
MTPREQVDRVLAAFGDAIGLDGLALDDAGMGTIFVDDTAVALEFDAPGERLLLYTSLGVPEGDPAAAHAELLEANLFWRGTAGATFALQPETGSVLLVQALPGRDLELAGFETALQAFVDTSEAWEQRLQAPPAAAAPAHPMPMDVIRG